MALPLLFGRRCGRDQAAGGTYTTRFIEATPAPVGAGAHLRSLRTAALILSPPLIPEAAAP